MAEAVEALDLAVRVTPHRVPLRQARDELAHTRPDLVCEVGGRRPDEGVDVFAGGLPGGK